MASKASATQQEIQTTILISLVPWHDTFMQERKKAQVSSDHDLLPLVPLVVCWKWQNIGVVCCVCVSEESREDQRTFLLIGLCMQQASKARAEQKSLVFLSLRPGKHIYQMGALMFLTLGPREPLQKSPPYQCLRNCKSTKQTSFTTGSIQSIFDN